MAKLNRDQRYELNTLRNDLRLYQEILNDVLTRTTSDGPGTMSDIGIQTMLENLTSFLEANRNQLERFIYHED